MIRISTLRYLEGSENNLILGLRHHWHNDFVNSSEWGAEEKVGVDYLPDIECHSGVNWAELSVSRLGQL